MRTDIFEGIGFFEEDFRKDIWDRLEECEKMCGSLKWIAQIGLPITKEEFQRCDRVRKNLVDSIEKIRIDLYSKIKCL